MTVVTHIERLATNAGVTVEKHCRLCTHIISRPQCYVTGTREVKLTYFQEKGSCNFTLLTQGEGGVQLCKQICNTLSFAEKKQEEPAVWSHFYC